MPSQSPHALTSPEGPVVLSEKTLCALIAIRREGLIAELYGPVVMARSTWIGAAKSADARRRRDATFDADSPPPWIKLVDDERFAHVELPERCGRTVATPSELATLRVAVGWPASLVLLDGPIKEKAKLSFIKAEGVVSMLVMAFRLDKLSAAKPMVTALEKLGYGDVLPPEEALEALWAALEGLE